MKRIMDAPYIYLGRHHRGGSHYLHPILTTKNKVREKSCIICSFVNIVYTYRFILRLFT